MGREAVAERPHAPMPTGVVVPLLPVIIAVNQRMHSSTCCHMCQHPCGQDELEAHLVSEMVCKVLCGIKLHACVIENALHLAV